MSVPFKRIVLVVERVGADTETSVRLACELAGRHGSPLLGLYMEDLQVLRSASLPGSTEIRMHTATRAALSAQALQRQLHGEAHLLEQWLAQTRRRASRLFDYSLQVCRGLPIEEMDRQLLADDLVILSRPPLQPGFLAGKRLVQSTLRLPQPFTVLLTAAASTEGSLGVLVESGGAAAGQLLATALSLAAADAPPLVVFVASNAPGADGRLQQSLAEQATRAGRAIHLRTIDARQPAGILRALNRFHGRALVVSRSSPFLSSASGRQLLYSAPLPLYLVAQGPAAVAG